MHSYNSIDTAAVWKESHFILLDRSNFHMIDNLSAVFHGFAWCMLTSILVDEILLLRFVNLSTYFRSLPLRVEMAPFI